MPRLFMHIQTPLGRMEDLDGAQFPSVEQARTEAFAAVAGLVICNRRAGKPVHGLEIQICDEAGRLLETIPVEGIAR